MTWVKLSDDFWMHAKIIGVGDSAAGLYARLISYCGFQLTDGLVPGPMLDMIVGKNQKGLAALVDAGLVEQLESGSVIVSDFLDYNRSKADWDADKAQKRVNGSKGGRPRTTLGNQ